METITTKTLLDEHETILRELGYEPQRTEQSVDFKHEDLLYRLEVTEKAPNYFRLLLPGIYDLKDAKNREHVYRTLIEVTGQLRVAKLFLVGEHVWGAYETYRGASSVKEILPVALRHVTAIGKMFFQRMSDEQAK